MKLSHENHLEDKGLGLPLSELDQMSDINISKREIILRESNGACSSATVTYAPSLQPGKSMRLIGRRQYVTDFSDPKAECYVEDYIAINPSAGEGYKLKLISRKLVN